MVFGMMKCCIITAFLYLTVGIQIPGDALADFSSADVNMGTTILAVRYALLLQKYQDQFCTIPLDVSF